MTDSAWLSLVPRFLRDKLRGRHVLQKTIGSTGWVILDKVVRLGLGLVVTVWMARYLGPADFGLLNYAIAFIALFSIFSNLGMQGLIVRELVNRPERRDALLGSALVLRVAGSLFAAVSAIGVVYLLRPGDSQSHWVVAIIALTLIPQAWDLIEYEYQADINSRPIVIIRNLSFLVCSIAKIALIYLGGSLIGLAWITTAEIALSAVVMNGLAQRQNKQLSIANATSAELRYLLRTCWPLIVTGLSVVLYWRIDQVMLGQIGGDAEVGVFSAAVRVSEVWYFVPVAIASSVAPALTAIYQRSKAEYMDHLLGTMRLLVWMAIAVAIGFTLFATPIIHLLYGPKYAQASTILAIHAWAGIFVALGLVASGWFLNTGLLHYSMYQTSLGALTNIGLNLVLIPRLGGVGAAMSTVASYAVSAVLANVLFRKSRELFKIQVLSCIPGPVSRR